MPDDLTIEELEVKPDELEVGEDEDEDVDEDVDEDLEDDDNDADEDEDSEEKGEKDKPSPGDSDLQTRLEELETANQGLIKSLSAQRGIKQDLQGQLDEIKDAIAESRETNLDLDDADNDPKSTANIPVEFDDDGNMFIEPKYLKTDMSGIKSLQEEINSLRQDLSDKDVQKQEDKQLSNLLGEKVGYEEAHKQVQEAWSYLKDDTFDAYLEKNNLTAPSTPDQAIDMIMGSKELSGDFQKKYPTLDLESVLEAKLLGTPRYLRKALNAALTTSDSSNEQLDLGKPNSLANANSGGSDTPESLLNKVADMSTEDYEKLDARTIAKIDKLLEAAG